MRLLVVTLIVATAAPALADRDEVQLHLLRRVEVVGDTLTLGQLGVVRCGDEALKAKASAVAMGRAPFAKETLAITRDTVLSRLVAEGIDKRSVNITGAVEVAVARQEKAISAAELAAAAEKHLRECGAVPEGCSWRAVQDFRETVVPAVGEIELKTAVLDAAPQRHLRVEVAVVCGDRTLARGEAMYRLTYPYRQATATAEIVPGAVVTPENAMLRTVMSDNPEPADWANPVGMIATRRIAPGDVIAANSVRPVQAPLLVKRDQRVVMRVSGPGYVIKTVGEALEDGRCGDMVRVRNVDSKRVVTARVAEDGTVEPMVHSTAALAKG